MHAAVIVGILAVETVVVAVSMMTVVVVIVAMVVIAIVIVAWAVVVVMISPPRVSVIRIAPAGIVVRHTPAKAPVWRVVMIAEAPVPIVIPRLVDIYIIIAVAIRWTVETVDTRGVAIIHDVLLGIIHLIVFLEILVAILLLYGRGVVVIIVAANSHYPLCAIHVVHIYCGGRSIEHNAGAENRYRQGQCAKY